MANATKVRVQYEFDRFKKDYIAEPFRSGLYASIEEYRVEFQKYFPNAIIEFLPVEIIEFEVYGTKSK